MARFLLINPARLFILFYEVSSLGGRMLYINRILSTLILLLLTSPLLAAGSTTELSRKAVEDLIPRLTSVQTDGKELLGGKVKADKYLQSLDEFQKYAVELFSKHGTILRQIDRYDFNGLPVCQIMRNAGREVQEESVITSSGHLEVGRGRIAGALEMVPTDKGGYLNRIALYLFDEYAMRIVIEAGSIDNIGAAASFNREGRYLSIPIWDASADAISFMTFHELCHLVTSINQKNSRSLMNGDMRGDRLADLMKSQLYNQGFSVDELLAYPMGVNYSASLRFSEEGRAVSVPYFSSGKGGKVLDAYVIGHRLRLINKEESRERLLRQLNELLDDFLNVLAKLSDSLQLKNESAKISMMNFMDETLIFSPDDNKVRVNIDLMYDALLGSGTPLTEPVLHLSSPKHKLAVKFVLEKELAQEGRKILETAERVTKVQGGTSEFTLWKDLLEYAQQVKGPLPEFVTKYKKLNANLDKALTQGTFDEAEAVVKQMCELANSQSNQQSLKIEDLAKKLEL